MFFVNYWIFSFTFILLFLAAQVLAQGKAPANWYLSNPADSKVYGVGAEEAYKLLTGIDERYVALPNEFLSPLNISIKKIEILCFKI